MIAKRFACFKQEREDRALRGPVLDEVFVSLPSTSSRDSTSTAPMPLTQSSFKRPNQMIEALTRRENRADWETRPGGSLQEVSNGEQWTPTAKDALAKGICNFFTEVSGPAELRVMWRAGELTRSPGVAQSSPGAEAIPPKGEAAAHEWSWEDLDLAVIAR